MRTLYLLRHAKSDWSDPGFTDFDRPLAARGVNAAHQVGALLAMARPRPQMVLCSSAARARATWQPIAEALGGDIEARIEDALYQANASRLLVRLRRLHEGEDAVLLIGHNPGLWDLAGQLAGDGDPSTIARLNEKFPTAALAVLGVERAWRQLGPGQARLESFITPRDL